MARPTLLTVHDVQYLHYPQYFSTARRAYLRHRMPRSVEAASAIAVPSNFVAGTLTESFGTDPQRIVVVPHGYDPPVRTLDRRRRGTAAPLRTRRPSGHRVPGDHSPAQGSPAARRSARRSVGRPRPRARPPRCRRCRRCRGHGGDRRPRSRPAASCDRDGCRRSTATV